MNSVGRQSHELGRERSDQRVRHARLCEELQAPLEGGDEIDPVAEHDARMRVERDHGRLEPGVDRRPEHRAMSAVDTVERPDRDRSRPPLELGRRMRDPHRAAASLGSASSSGTTRCSSASSTRNGPISVRLRVEQWPPSASAIERT